MTKSDTIANQAFKGTVFSQALSGEFNKGYLFKEGKMCNLHQPQDKLGQNAMMALTTCADWYTCVTVTGSDIPATCTYSGTECATTYVDDGGGSSSSSSGGSMPTGGGGGVSPADYIDVAAYSNYIVPSGPETKIPNKSLYFNCLDPNNPAVVTIYVDQPKPGIRDVINNIGYVGHTFIGIKQMQNNGTLCVSRVFGFYPETYASPTKTSDNGVLKVNESHSYDISFSISVTPAQLGALINYIVLNNRSYDLSAYNCTSYALGIANKFLDANLPNTISCWLPSPSGCGNNPGDLGEDLRNKKGAISSPNSNAPANSGCPADLP